jgi:hypothetical protein
VDSGHDADHEFYGTLKLIWAHGRSDDAFYREDEIKYHGGNRGHYTLRKSGARLLAPKSQRPVHNRVARFLLVQHTKNEKLGRETPSLIRAWNLILNKKPIVLFERHCLATEKSEAIACARSCWSFRLTR